MGNICYAEQDDQNDAPRDLPQQFDIPVSTLNLRTCLNCECFKSIDFKYAIKLMNIKGFDEKIQLLANISIPKLHKYFKVQEQLRFLPECRDMEFDEIREFNYIIGLELSEPQDILVKIIPQNMTTSWFQRFLSCKKKKSNYDLQTRNQFLYYNSRIQDVKLSDVEQLLVFYLRWGVSFEKFKFISYNQIKDDYLRFIYDHLKYMYHLTLTLNILIYKYPIEDEFLLIYAIIYKTYHSIIWQYQEEYDFCGDGLMGMYQKYFESRDQEPTSPEDRMPHFNLISIYQRYWCKRVMISACSEYNPNLKIVKLIEQLNQKIISLRQKKELKDNSDSESKLLRTVFSQILDCSVNEISIHWVGHSKLNFADEYLGQFIMELKKQSKDYYQQRYNNLNFQEFSQFVDEDLSLMESIFPEWFITHFIKGIGILMKADKLKDYLQLLLNDQILSIKSSEEINNDLILALKKEAETQYLNQQKFMKQKDKIQQLQEQPELVVLQQSEGFIKFLQHKKIKVRSKVEKTALFLDSISRIQRNNYDVAQISTIQQIQKNIADQTTRASDTSYIAEGDIKFYLTDTLINEFFEPSQESLDIARELEQNNENLITNIYELDRQQKQNNQINQTRDDQVYSYVESLKVSKERSLEKLSFTKNYDFDNFNNIKLQKWKNIKKQYEYQYYDGIITKLGEAIRNQDQTIKNKERKLKDAQNKLKYLNS